MSKRVYEISFKYNVHDDDDSWEQNYIKTIKAINVIIALEAFIELFKKELEKEYSDSGNGREFILEDLQSLKIKEISEKTIIEV